MFPTPLVSQLVIDPYCTGQFAPVLSHESTAFFSSSRQSDAQVAPKILLTIVGAADSELVGDIVGVILAEMLSVGE